METPKRCDQCGKPLTPRRKRFCCNKCKDHYHNIHNPRGYYAPGKETVRDIIPQGFPTNLIHMINYKSHIADMTDGEEDCGNKY